MTCGAVDCAGLLKVCEARYEIAERQVALTHVDQAVENICPGDQTHAKQERPC